MASFFDKVLVTFFLDIIKLFSVLYKFILNFHSKFCLSYWLFLKNSNDKNSLSLFAPLMFTSLISLFLSAVYRRYIAITLMIMFINDCIFLDKLGYLRLMQRFVEEQRLQRQTIMWLLFLFPSSPPAINKDTSHFIVSRQNCCNIIIEVHSQYNCIPPFIYFIPPSDTTNLIWDFSE